jgi:hypothetical protein
LKYICLHISEVTHLEQGQEDISALLRTLKTTGSSKRDVTQKRGNDFYTITLEVEGPTPFIGTTTSFAGKDEDTNRDIFCRPDDTQEQTKKIRQAKNNRRKKYDPNYKNWITENRKVQEVVQDILVKLIPVYTEIPYIDRINYPDREERARRDGDKVDIALQAICHVNMLNRKIKLIDAKPIVEDIKKFIQEYNFKTSDSHAVVSIQNIELSHHFKENLTISNQNNCTSEVQELNCPEDNYEAVIGLDGEHVVIDSPDPFLNYGTLEEFVHRRKYEFVLISDERDFNVLKEFFAQSIESAYNELEHTLMKNYRLLVKEGERTDNYEFTASKFAKLVNQSDTWTLKILHKLAEKDFAELLNPGKKPLKFKVTKNKLAASFDTEQNSKEYRLYLKEPGENPEPCCFDSEYCRITRQFFIKPANEIKTTELKSELPNVPIEKNLTEPTSQQPATVETTNEQESFELSEEVSERIQQLNVFKQN